MTPRILQQGPHKAIYSVAFSTAVVRVPTAQPGEGVRDVEKKTISLYKSDVANVRLSAFAGTNPPTSACNASRLRRYRVSSLAVVTLNRTFHERSEKGVGGDSARLVRTEGVMV